MPDNAGLTSFAAHACDRCASRKVKCSRQLPTCERCVETRSVCVYIAPPPRRRKRKVFVSSSAAAAKLKQYEEVLRAHGIAVPESASESRDIPPLSQNLTAAYAPSNYATQSGAETNSATLSTAPQASSIKKAYGGNELWKSLTQLRSGTDMNDDYAPRPLARDDQPLENDADPLWGATTNINLQESWPESNVALTLWQTYLERFQPIYKILHAPTVAKLVHKGAATCVTLSTAEQALLFAIFATAVYTVTDENECVARFGENRSSLLRIYRRAARAALSNANYLLTMDLMVLQAFVIFLRSLRYDFDSSPLWTLTGIAIRNGKRMGLDRVDEILECSPLEVQERRLLWFNMIYFDAYIAEVAGVREPWNEFQRQLQTPMNLNDDDINSDMTEFPPEREGATDPMFTMMRYDWIRAAQKVGLPHVSGTNKGGNSISREDQDRAMDEIEDLFARKYIRHCDPTVPMQFWVLLTAKCMLVEMRLSTYLSRRDQNLSNPSVIPEDDDTPFKLSLKALEYEYMAQSAESLKVFQWHMSDQIPRVAVIWMVAELCKRAVGTDVDAAWLQLEATFSKHPELINHTQRPWISQLRRMVLEAWDFRETYQRQNQLQTLSCPKLIVELRNQRLRASDERVSGQASPIIKPVARSLQGGLDGFDSLNDALVSDGTTLDFAGIIDWCQWGSQ